MLTAVLSVVLVSLIGVRLIRQAEARVALSELRRQAEAVSNESTLVKGQPRQALRFLRRALNLNQAAIYRVEESGGLVLVDGEPDVDLTPADTSALKAGQTIEGTRSSPAGDVLFVAKPIGGAARTRVLVVGRTVESSVGTLPVGPRILIAALFAAAAAALVSFFVSNRVAEPLGELADAVGDIAKGNFSRRVPVRSDDEIGVVAESFNSMAAELEDSDKRQREFFLSISHELRTPLTAIQGYAEAIEDGTAGSENSAQAAGVIVGESRRLARLVSDLLDLARIDARRFQVTLSAVPVDEVLSTVQRNFTPRAAELGVSIDPTPASGTVSADRDRLVQVLSNLVENALRYTPPNRSIRLSGAVSGDWVQMRVEDAGPGLDGEDLSHAFERQYLWTKYRGLRDVGTGLGLAITKELTEAMGGRVSAANGPTGGAIFTVELPATRSI